MHRHTHTHAGDTYPFTLTRKKEHNNFIGAKAISSGTMALIHQKRNRAYTFIFRHRYRMNCI